MSSTVYLKIGKEAIKHCAPAKKKERTKLHNHLIRAFRSEGVGEVKSSPPEIRGASCYTVPLLGTLQNVPQPLDFLLRARRCPLPFQP